ncbi:hypothetical protein MHI57_16655 [Cytobacillus sp. FSL K6-0129]|uniref:hypothetical protein n=1 Tax=Cytobacillus sp. FSL K6-0129 TaxID=2921421 RepID=UPI0030FA7F13
MRATESIQRVWEQFNTFPMENLTKIWHYQKGSERKQRELSLMKEHREQYGLAGNCFDLAIWLLDAFRQAKIQAFPIGHHLGTVNAHVAVIALDDDGGRYLCDLGDQWLNPVLIDKKRENFTSEKLGGFFPGANIQMIPNEYMVEVRYHRPNGKESKQIYDTRPIDCDVFLHAAEHSQNLIKPTPLLECRVPYQTEVAHWEFTNWISFLSTNHGLIKDSPLVGIDEWVMKIHEKTGYNKEILLEMLKLYHAFQNK